MGLVILSSPTQSLVSTAQCSIECVPRCPAAMSAGGPIRPTRERKQVKPYVDEASAKLNAQAAAHKKKLAHQATLKPIPIEPIFVGEAPVTIVDDTLWGAVPEDYITKHMSPWKYINGCDDGFGSFTPKSVGPWPVISRPMVQKVTAGFQGARSFKVAESDAYGASIREDIIIVGTHEQFIDAYAEACERGDASFKLKINKIWECYFHGPPVCFGGGGEVLMADGTHLLVRDVAVGDKITVLGGTATIAAVWRANVGRTIPMVSIDGVLLTPDHPVSVSDAWQKALEITASKEIYVDAVYNFALTASHSLWVKAGTGKYVHCCTLGKPVPGIPEPLPFLPPCSA